VEKTFVTGNVSSCNVSIVLSFDSAIVTKPCACHFVGHFHEMSEHDARVWRVQKSELVLDNQWAKVRRDVCELPNGAIIPDYYYWEGGDFAQIFAITPAHEIVVTRHYRHAVKQVVTGLPAGFIDPEDATPLATAQRELREETGYTGSDWVDLGALNISSAKATTRAFIFLLKDAVREFEPQPDPQETVDVMLIGLRELLDLISKNEIQDSTSLATTLRAMQTLGWTL
jgi:ADP-ribose pyrophosphatase